MSAERNAVERILFNFLISYDSGGCCGPSLSTQEVERLSADLAAKIVSRSTDTDEHASVGFYRRLLATGMTSARAASRMCAFRGKDGHSIGSLIDAGRIEDAEEWVNRLETGAYV